MRGNYNIGTTKLIVSILNWFGLIVSALGVASVLYILANGDDYSLTQNFSGALTAADKLFYTIILFGSCMSVASCAFIIYFTKVTDDETFVNNRYILILFSLSVSGVLTPFILTRLPNEDVRSSIVPRVSISQGYGVVFAFTGLITFAYLATITKWGSMFNNIDKTQTYTSIFTIVTLVVLIWGVINLGLFSGKGATERLEKSGARVLMLIVSTINLVLGTITLVWIIIISVLNIISAIGSLFERGRGAFASILNGLRVALTISLQVFIIYTAWNCIKGIWSNENFAYNRSENLARRQEEYNSRF